MRLPRSILLTLALVVGLVACQSGPPRQSDTATSDPILADTEPGSDGGILTPTEEDIIQAFEYELDEQWLEAGVLYERLAQSSIQPERSAFLVKVALMYYQGGLYDEIDPFFDTLSEQDILLQDQPYKETVRAGGYLGEGKIYQSLLALPEIEEIIDYRYKALALNIRSRGVLAIGKPLESAKLRMQISQFLKSPQEIESNNNFIWDALYRITESAMLRALAEQQTAEVRGWLELNLIVRRSNMLPVKMEPWIDQWYQLYDDHAAAPSYAINLLQESKRIYINPTRIALMLPFSGRLEKVADAIQNGFLYAYYQDPGLTRSSSICNTNRPFKMAQILLSARSAKT